MNFRAVLRRIQGNEKGSVLILALMLLAILTILGLAATQSSWFEVSVAGNDRLYRDSFSAAESTISEVINDPVVMGGGNISGDPQGWPDPDAAVPRAIVQYQGSSAAILRGEGDDAGQLRGHIYQIEARGEAPRGARSTVSVAGYRIGF